jgi:hypothetical protein
MAKFHVVVRRTCPQLAEVIVNVEQPDDGADIREVASNRAIELAQEAVIGRSDDDDDHEIQFIEYQGTDDDYEIEEIDEVTED